MVIPLKDCIARPDGPDGTIYPLRDHLEAVAFGCGDYRGERQEQLKFLAGLLHDAGKAQSSWQSYIGGEGPRVPHSSFGAALFTFFAYKLIGTWSPRRKEKRELYFLSHKLARDINDHHGELHDLTDEVIWYTAGSWLDSSVLKSVDITGLSELIEGYFPGLAIVPEELFNWLKNVNYDWERLFNEAKSRINDLLDEAEDEHSAAAALCLRRFTASFIAADRYHAAGLHETVLQPAEARKALDRLNTYCRVKAKSALASGQASERMVGLRQAAQDASFKKYLDEKPSKRIFALTLPTGVGKTFTALRISLAACAAGECRRIIYVAPYLSILSQAAGEIASSSDLEVMQHHHLSLVDQKGAADGTEMDEQFFLAVESWQAPVVATTFNQFFRALFPRRAQQSMRLDSCAKAFLIIDEPQIIDGKVWNLFLRMLDAATREYQMQAMFVTATLPPLEKGLTLPVARLAPEKLDVPGRYIVCLTNGPLDEQGVAELAAEDLKRTGSVAVVMNTVRDAAQVYQVVKNLVHDGTAVFNLSGCMTPLHKAKRIEEISCFLACGYPTVVVCTQILEAGVDLSFRSVLRALPVIPAVAQVAGRANRHFTGDKARVIVFPFRRGGEMDTRKFVYREKESVTATDEVLNQYNRGWEEVATPEIVCRYYKHALDINPKTAFLGKLSEAAVGRWSSLAGIEPFGADYPQLSIFIPWGEHFLSWRMRQLLYRYSPHGTKGLFEKYLDKDFRSNLSFFERKQFMALMQQFVVQISTKYVDFASIFPDNPIGIINKQELYLDDTGLAHLYDNDDFTSCIIL
ncbi:MAG: CRISPR-associated helicase Cas3' [Bacillota bacterium]